MKITVAMDSFKGSLDSLQCGRAVAEGIYAAIPSADIRILPLADGGEGTSRALTSALGGQIRNVSVTGPLGNSVKASYGIISSRKLAVIEMASAAGLYLVPEEQRDPMETTTFGVGEMIRDAVDRGCRSFIVGIGGSSTNDGGTGMLEALGWRFYDAAGRLVHGCGAALEQIVRVDDSFVPADVRAAEYVAACDVDTPFYGPEGAAFVFAPQKGASPALVKRLEAGMRSFSGVVAGATGVLLDESVPGAGAAGGVGGALYAFLGASLVPGVEMVLEAVGFDALLRGADYVVTGEGRMDGQSVRGKLVSGVLRHACACGVPVFALCGAVDGVPEGFRRVVAVSEGIPLEVAMREDVARARLRGAAANLL